MTGLWGAAAGGSLSAHWSCVRACMYGSDGGRISCMFDRVRRANSGDVDEEDEEGGHRGAATAPAASLPVFFLNKNEAHDEDRRDEDDEGGSSATLFCHTRKRKKKKTRVTQDIDHCCFCCCFCGFLFVSCPKNVVRGRSQSLQDFLSWRERTLLVHFLPTPSCRLLLKLHTSKPTAPPFTPQARRPRSLLRLLPPPPPSMLLACSLSMLQSPSPPCKCLSLTPVKGR